MQELGFAIKAGRGRQIFPSRAKRVAHVRILVCLAAAMLLAPAAQIPAAAAASSVSGGAYGWMSSVSLFGGPTNTFGNAASDAVVDLPAGGTLAGPTSLADAAPTGLGQYGPARIYQSGPSAVSTKGDPGTLTARPAVVRSSSSVLDIGYWHGVMLEDATGVWDPTIGGEMDPFIALEVTSTCEADQGAGAVTGSSSIVGGRVVDTDANGNPVNARQVPLNPAPGTVMTGELAHIVSQPGNVTEKWRITFNEQIAGPNSITVNAVHLELLGPIAVGHVRIGQTRCGYTP